AMERHGEYYFEAELLRVRGELLVRYEPRGAASSSARARAQQCFLRARDVARRQQAKSLELRAAISLSRLLRRGARGAQAQSVLREVFAEFTEGFDTPDRQEAAALVSGGARGASSVA